MSSPAALAAAAANSQPLNHHVLHVMRREARGLGFVEFFYERDARDALSGMDGMDLAGRRVSSCTPLFPPVQKP